MVDIYLKFVIRLVNNKFYKGPLFHKWLPNDENDAIVLGKHFNIKVWFERRGFLDGSFIRYNADKCEVRDDLIPKQAVLDGGFLFASAKYNASEEQIRAVQSEELDNDDYCQLGKEIITHVLMFVSKFIDLLRVDYGQYWIKPLLGWDSRKEYLGEYFDLIRLRWRLDNKSEWKLFQPTKNERYSILNLPSDDFFQTFITQEDWFHLKKFATDKEFEEYKPNLAKKTLTKAQQSWDESNYSEAFISVISALELAISSYIKKRVPVDIKFYDRLNNVFIGKKPKITLPEQVATIFSIKKDFELNLIEKALDGIEIRNDIIHRGEEKATESNIDEFLALSKCVQSLIFEPHYKYPTFTTSNTIEK